MIKLGEDLDVDTEEAEHGLLGIWRITEYRVLSRGEVCHLDLANISAATQKCGCSWPADCRDPGVNYTIGLTCRMLFLFSPVIEEGGVKMKLTVIDTPGFGDQINNENWYVSASVISSLNTLLGRHNADSFPLTPTCILLGKRLGLLGECYPC